MIACKAVAAPRDGTGLQLTEEKCTKYPLRELSGSLRFLSMSTRFAIMQAINKLLQFYLDPVERISGFPKRAKSLGFLVRQKVGR